MIKYTNKIIDDMLCNTNRKIKLISAYSGMHNICNWKCTECYYEWQTTPRNIFYGGRKGQGTGCSRCNGVSKLTNELIDNKLLKNNIQVRRLSDYKNNKEVMQWECLVPKCGYIISTSTSNILNHKSGCKKCLGLIPLTNDIVDQRLYKKNIIRMDEFKTVNDSMLFKCALNYCKYEWITTPSQIFKGGGCPKCSGCAPLTDEEIDRRLCGRNIKRLDKSCGKRIKIRWQCENDKCLNIWLAPPGQILYGKQSGCPNCKIGKNEKLVKQTLEQFNISFEHRFYISKIDKLENNKFSVDFYLPHNNLIIEYNGAQHYEPVCFGNMSFELAFSKLEKQKLRDKHVEKFCINNNIKLIWIDGRKYKGQKLIGYVEKMIIEENLLNNNGISI